MKKSDLKRELDRHKVKLPGIANTPLTYAPTVSATVNATPQILRPLRPFGGHSNEMAALSNNGRYVLEALFSCFTKQGFVKEGLVKDIIWGFVDVGNMDQSRVAMGLIDLYRAGLIGFRTQDNIETDEHCSQLAECFLFYKPKLMRMVAS